MTPTSHASIFHKVTAANAALGMADESFAAFANAYHSPSPSPRIRLRGAAAAVSVRPASSAFSRSQAASANKLATANDVAANELAQTMAARRCATNRSTRTNWLLAIDLATNQ